MQRGKLNKSGQLRIERKGLFKYQYCPYNAGEDDLPCGDFCPLFEEFERDYLLVRTCIRKTEIKIIEDLRGE